MGDEPFYDEKSKTKRKAQGLSIFERACKEGNADSCHIAGSHYLNIKHADRNPTKAVEYLGKSCEKNHVKSCYNLAVLYRNGDTELIKIRRNLKNIRRKRTN